MQTAQKKEGKFDLDQAHVHIREEEKNMIFNITDS